MPKKIDSAKFAKELMRLFINENIDDYVRIYYNFSKNKNGQAIQTDPTYIRPYNNKPVEYNETYNGKKNKWYIIEDINPNDYFEYNGDILSISFDGSELYNILNCYAYKENFMKKFKAIFDKYNVYYELGNAWNLSVYPNDEV